MKIGSIGMAAMALFMGSTLVQAAPYLYWNGSVSTNWHDAENWTVTNPGGPSAVPTIADVAYISEIPANVPTMSTVATSLTLRVAYTSGSSGMLNVVDGANFVVAANSDRVGASGGTGTLNQYGGTLELNRMEIGLGAGSTGVWNMYGGVFKTKGTSTLGGQAGSSLSVGNAGTGAFNLHGGTVITRGGIVVGGASAGDGSFNVFGGGVVSNGNSYAATSGFWYQHDGGTLSATVDSSNGFSLGQIIIRSSTNDNPYVTFQYGAMLDVGFSGADMGDVTNTWEIMTWPTNTVVMDNGLAFSGNVDLDLWSFAVSSNALRITYGIGSNPVIVTNPPPSSPRVLYWTGNGSDKNATNAANWSLDAAGTSTVGWGVYSGDTLNVGYSGLVGAQPVECTFAGLPFAAQNRLYIGRASVGIVNFESGEMTLPKPSSGVSSYIGWNSADGDGTLNMGGGTLDLYATDVGAQGSHGTLNVNGGDFLLSGRIASSGGTTPRASLWLGSAGGSGTVTVAGGSMKALLGVVLGDTSGVGTFFVEGAGASEIALGATRNDFDGYWVQNAGSTLKIRIDGTDAGVTPITIYERGNDNGGDLPAAGRVVFETGSILDVGWMAGVTNYGDFDVMKFGGTYVDNGLTFAPGVDTNLWSFSFVDTNGDATNDTLRVSSDVDTAFGTSLAWLKSHGLGASDDAVDNDGDGMLTWKEYVAGTDPTNTASVLSINSFGIDAGNLVINWQSIEGKSYSVVTNSDLVNGTPGTIASGISGLPTETAYTTTVNGASTVFYAIGVQ